MERKSPGSAHFRCLPELPRKDQRWCLPQPGLGCKEISGIFSNSTHIPRLLETSVIDWILGPPRTVTEVFLLLYSRLYAYNGKQHLASAFCSHCRLYPFPQRPPATSMLVSYGATSPQGPWFSAEGHTIREEVYD